MTGLVWCNKPSIWILIYKHVCACLYVEHLHVCKEGLKGRTTKSTRIFCLFVYLCVSRVCVRVYECVCTCVSLTLPFLLSYSHITLYLSSSQYNAVFALRSVPVMLCSPEIRACDASSVRRR